MEQVFRESETVELKKSTSELKEAIVSIVGMLNKHGRGEVYFGVGNDGTVIGQQVSDSTLREVSKAIFEGIEPKVYPKINELEIGGKKCIHVEFEGNEAPYFAFGGAYTRVGTENRQISAKELENIFAKKRGDTWEGQFSGKTLKDVNVKTLKEYVARANKARRIDFKFKDAQTTLNKLHLIRDGTLLRAAEVLFCNDNPLEVQAAVFAGTDKLTFLDIQNFKGNIFHILKKSGDYLKEHMNWRAELLPGGREEIPEIPLRALTEALVNSVCHRDYANPKGNEIAIFKDRIEIYNPGQFPEGVDINNFFMGIERSVLRNKLIAGTLFFSKDIERWGSGLKRIHDECLASNVKVGFVQLKTGFLVVFRRPEQQTQKVTEKVTENQRKIIEALAKNPRCISSELSAMLGISERKTKENIAKLKQKGVLKRIGPDRGGYWETIGGKA